MIGNVLLMRAVSVICSSGRFILPHIQCYSGNEGLPLSGLYRTKFSIREYFPITTNNLKNGCLQKHLASLQV